MKKTSPIKFLAVILFGVAFPLFTLSQAYLGTNKLSDNIGDIKSLDEIISSFKDVKEMLDNANQYALFSLMHAEHANKKTMINKQVMKTTIIQIGFAVISMGMLFIILGINDGGLEGQANFADISFDFKTGSTGIVAFVIGAIMASAGGILKNEYNTVPIPDYVNATQKPEIVKVYNKCKTHKKIPLDQCIESYIKQKYKK